MHRPIVITSARRSGERPCLEGTHHRQRVRRPDAVGFAQRARKRLSHDHAAPPEAVDEPLRGERPRRLQRRHERAHHRHARRQEATHQLRPRDRGDELRTRAERVEAVGHGLGRAAARLLGVVVAASCERRHAVAIGGRRTVDPKRGRHAQVRKQRVAAREDRGHEEPLRGDLCHDLANLLEVPEGRWEKAVVPRAAVATPQKAPPRLALRVPGVGAPRPRPARRRARVVVARPVGGPLFAFVQKGRVHGVVGHEGKPVVNRHPVVVRPPVGRPVDARRPRFVLGVRGRRLDAVVVAIEHRAQDGVARIRQIERAVNVAKGLPRFDDLPALRFVGGKRVDRSLGLCAHERLRVPKPPLGVVLVPPEREAAVVERANRAPQLPAGSFVRDAADLPLDLVRRLHHSRPSHRVRLSRATYAARRLPGSTQSLWSP